MGRLAKVKVDWDTARALASRGVSTREISEKTGAPIATIRQRRKRENWSKLRDNSDKTIASIIASNTADAASSWVRDITRLVSRQVSSLSKRDPDSMSTKSVLELMNAAKVADDIARRSYRLDESKSATVQIAINCGSLSVPYSSEVGPAIDVPSQIVDKPS